MTECVEKTGLQMCSGGCHCGAVRFTVLLPAVLDVLRCNCSICAMSGYQHVTVNKDDFNWQKGHKEVTEYRFNTGQARHLFCRHCGIKSFYQPRSHPEAYSVNLACLDIPYGTVIEFRDFDGRHWEEHVEEISDAVNDQ